MTGMQLFKALSQVEDKYLSESAPKKRTVFRNKWVFLAASLSLVVLAGFTAKLISGWEIIPPPSQENGDALLRWTTGPYPLSEKAQALLESHLSDHETWENIATSPEELEALMGIHLLTVQGDTSLLDWDCAAERKEEGGILLWGHYWQQGWQQLPGKDDEREVQWTIAVSSVLDTVGGTKEQPWPDVPEGYLSIRQTVHLDALNTEAEMFFYASDFPVSNADMELRHNVINCFLVYDEIAYSIHIRAALGAEIDAGEAFERAADVLSQLR